MNVRRKLFVFLFMIMCFLPICSIKAEAKKIYTGNARVDCAAEKIIKRCTKPGMSRRQKLKSVYTYLVKAMRYSHSTGHTRVHVIKKEIRKYRKSSVMMLSSKKIRYSSQFASDYANLLTLQGTCKDMSGVFCILANHLGYRAGYARGRYVRSNGSSTEHWWNYVVIDGKRYYCDVQAANDSWDRHHSMSAVRSFYLRDKKSRGWRKHHRG
ncbi:MAG: transglutaminase domain-containing protein [Lachnospiraceae bacterium]|nr:transglutaminase domain-containing protein [Lachnospiraceae bacterium]